MRALVVLSVIFVVSVSVSASELSVRTQYLPLGESAVRVSVYEKRGAGVVLFVPHFNEQIAVAAAMAAVEKHGGRLVVIESVDESSHPMRRLNFVIDGVRASIDPNRIYTPNGRNCGSSNVEINKAADTFATQLLELLFPDGRQPSLLVAVHNNTDSTAKLATLSAPAFSSQIGGDFADQAAGVYLSNLEPDPDNFVIVSRSELMSYFGARSFNVVVQKSATMLTDKRCTVDDGSMSVYSARNGINYICLEADAVTGLARQREMLDAVYDLARQSAQGQVSPGGIAKGLAVP